MKVLSTLLNSQVFMDLRQKIQKSELKESTWIFEKDIAIYITLSCPSCLCITESGWYD